MVESHFAENALKYLEVGYEEAEILLDNPEKMNRFLARLDKKMDSFPNNEPHLAGVSMLAELLKNYVQGLFPDVKRQSLVAVVSALYYVVSPFDLIPDRKRAGFEDDGAIVAQARKVAEEDLDHFLLWRNKQR